MLISIVNHSATIVDAKLQPVIRAINRQLRDDFEPYWGRGGQLRLEGRSQRSPNPERASDIRGEAVVYLCDRPDDAEEALGYHELTHRGIPYGFVFTELCKKLKEPWSLTLSHEVLELVLDPEVNLLVKGPHPSDPTREVFHWYEACDAVQTPLERLASLFPRVDAAVARDGLMEILGKPSAAALSRLHEEVRFWLALDPKLHAAVGAHLSMAESEQRSARRTRGRTAAAQAADSPRTRARSARVQRVRAALTASAVSQQLRESLWKR